MPFGDEHTEVVLVHRLSAQVQDTARVAEGDLCDRLGGVAAIERREDDVFEADELAAGAELAEQPLG